MSGQKFFAAPFAQTGDKTAVPNAAQVDGSVSYTEGWGFDYERDPATDPDAKRIPRDQSNQLMFDVTENVRQYQLAGFPEWVIAAQNGGVAVPYSINTYCRWNGGAGSDWEVYCSLVDANTTEPGTDPTKWQLVQPSSVATLKASQAETDQGTGAKLAGALELVKSAREGKWLFLGDLDQSAAPNYTGAFAGAAAFAQGAGATVVFTVAAPNAGGTLTLKVGANAALALRNPDGTDLAANDLVAGQLYEAKSNGVQWRLTQWTASRLALMASAGDGAIFGYLFTNTPGATATQITSTYGNCRDSTNQRSIPRPAPLTKRLDQPWAAGNGNGGRTSAVAVGPNQTWHVHAILNDTTGATDLIMDPSPTNPTLPAGYAFFRWAYAIRTDGANAIKQFIHFGDYTAWKVRGQEWAATGNGVAAGTLRNVEVPTGIAVLGEFYYGSTNGAGGTNSNPALSGVYNPNVGVPVFGTATQWAQIRVGWTSIADRYQTRIVEQWTNTAGQVYTASNDTGDVIAGGTLGWTYPRGQF